MMRIYMTDSKLYKTITNLHVINYNYNINDRRY